ncbi:MAG TPA: hypothetical protein VKX16_16585 [Chloroflexota bacterium]|nr:hypothetical protein [Chloroflexota bacterium]
MNQQNRQAPRQRGRELVTVLLAFSFTLAVGRALAQLLNYPPFLVTTLIFVVTYLAAWIVFWRLVGSVWRS